MENFNEKIIEWGEKFFMSPKGECGNFIMAEAAKKGKSHSAQLWKAYKVEGNSIVRLKKFSPKAGTGYFMAEHKDRRTCGKTMYMEKKTGK